MTELRDYLTLAPSRGHSKLWETYEQLVRQYSEPHRKYHNVVHVEFGYNQHQRFFGDMELIPFFAWTYHDVIYDPEAHDNEERSARQFLNDNAVLGFNYEDADRIAMLILSTTHTGEKNLITDIDLSGLGLAPEYYDQNTARIRQEYSFVDNATWKAGRTAFIKRFLAQDYIYYSPQFISAFEMQARENMLRELHLLNSQF